MSDPQQSQPLRAGAHADDKARVHDYWNEASCGEDLYLEGRTKADYARADAIRYQLEPYIAQFAKFEEGRGKRVLEIGVGMGADHQRWAESGAELHGLDLTERAIEHTTQRLSLFGLSSDLSVGDAEHLAYDDNTFDIVYSWGVLHHSPDTPRAVAEVRRVLKPGGVARVMIYHKHSLIGLMLWLRYAAARGRPLTSLNQIYATHLESPGTKAYTHSEARGLFGRFAEVSVDTVLTHGDLLESAAGQRHQGRLLDLARAVWPRRLLRRAVPWAGLFMMVTARK